MIWHPLVPWWLAVAVGGLMAAFAVGLAVRHARRRARWLRRGALALAWSLALLNPTVTAGSQAAALADVDALFVVDLSLSMGAVDGPDGAMRLDQARADLAALVAALPGARYTVIGFAGTARVLAPPTADAQAVTQLAATLARESAKNATPSAIGAAADLVAAQLARQRAAHPDRAQVVFYLGDGEQTSRSGAVTLGALADQVTAGAVLQYGTTVGAQIASYEGAGPDDGSCGESGVGRYASCWVTRANSVPGTYPQGAAGDAVISKADPAALALIAEGLGVEVVDRTAGGPVDALVAGIARRVAADAAAGLPGTLPLYWLFAVVAGACLLGEVATAVGERRRGFGAGRPVARDGGPSRPPGAPRDGGLAEVRP
ncbi:MAG: VWA domain-containing protein [Propionibacteriaceae bacterium]|jgi:Ca-activated chloride channel family protein|nr:VWA domain-containing protein [Propionibacteriaceae bacterium]